MDPFKYFETFIDPFLWIFVKASHLRIFDKCVSMFIFFRPKNIVPFFSPLTKKKQLDVLPMQIRSLVIQSQLKRKQNTLSRMIKLLGLIVSLSICISGFKPDEKCLTRAKLSLCSAFRPRDMPDCISFATISYNKITLDLCLTERQCKESRFLCSEIRWETETTN